MPRGSSASFMTTPSIWGTRCRPVRRCSRSAKSCENKRRDTAVSQPRLCVPAIGPCYNKNMSHPVIFDRSLLRTRRARAARLGPATFLIDRVAEDLAGRLSAVLRTFEVAADVGTATDAVRRALAGQVGTIVAVDPLARDDKTLAVAADEEALPFRDGSL